MRFLLCDAICALSTVITDAQNRHGAAGERITQYVPMDLHAHTVAFPSSFSCVKRLQGDPTVM